MRVVIAGAGEVGYHVAATLYREGVEIAAIDNDPQVLKRLHEEFNVSTFQGNATDTDTMAQAEVGRADLFLAITNFDETNIISCLMAAEAGASKRVARVKSIVLGEGGSVSDRTYLGIDLIINPYQVAAEQLAHLAQHPQLTDFNQFLDDRVLLIRLPVMEDSPLAGTRVIDFGKSTRIQQTLVALVEHRGQSVIPQAQTRIEKGDQVYFFCAREQLSALREALGMASRPSRRVFINGGGHIGLALAQRLEPKTPHVRIIEHSELKSRQLSQALTKALVLHADGTDSHTLAAEGIEQADSFISVTNRDSVNIVSCMLARRLGARHTVALVKQPEFIPVLSQRHIVDVGFSPRQATARKLLRFLHGEAVHSFFAFPGSDVEVLEMSLTGAAPCEDRPLAELELPHGLLVGAVKRGEAIFIPHGQDILRQGDRLLLVQQRRHRRVSQDLFQGTPSFQRIEPIRSTTLAYPGRGGGL